MKKILFSGSKAEIVIKKSKFISESFHIDTVDDANEILEKIRKKYWDATHNCYAYRLNENEKKCSDDGEPVRTAGYPILDVIDKNEINNCLIVVTRYFGGTLLGTGGLVKAYTEGAISSLSDATIIDIDSGYKGEIICNYEDYGSINYNLNELKIFVKDTEFTDKVRIIIYVFDNQKNLLLKKMQEILKKEEPIKVLYTTNMAILDGEMLEFE